MSALTVRETTRLAELEQVVERGLATFVDVGLALMEVRDARLYRATHATFEDYCRERWRMSRIRAHQLIGAASVTENLLTTVNTLPANEAQARPLARLTTPEEQREAWQEAVETAPRDDAGEPRITAAHVERVVEQRTNPMSVHYSSDSPEWYTPTHIIEAVVAVLGEIDLDPCSNAIDEPRIPARRHLTHRENGLAHEWRGRVYMNPPYGDGIGEWTGKLSSEYASGRVTEAIALVPARTDTRWFGHLRDHPRCFIAGRLRFSDNDVSAPFPSAAVYFGARVQRFAHAFAAVGDTYLRYELGA